MSIPNIKAAIGVQLRLRRKLRGEKLREVAPRAEISLGSLSAVEKGTNGPKLDTLYRIVVALEWSLSELFAAVESALPKEPK